MLKARFTHSLAIAALLAGVGGPAFADQSHFIVTVPAGGASGPIAVPITNSPLIISCAQNVAGNVGVGQVTMIRSTTGSGFLTWVGYDYNHGLVTGSSSALGAQTINSCDFNGQTGLQVYDANHIKVTNISTVSQTVDIMFVY